MSLLLLLASGCVSGSPKTPGPQTGGPGFAAPDNSTIEGVLLNSPHIKVVGTTTLSWEVENGSSESPAWRATLVKFTEQFKASFVAISGDVKFVAAVPLEATNGAPGCGAVPAGVKSFFRPRETVNRGVDNLSGNYGPGWYHFVVLSTGDGTFGISFDAKKEGKARTLPARDPYVTADFAAAGASRDPTLSLDTIGTAWVAWATTSVSGNTLTDGGRELSVNIAECQSGKSNGNSGGRNTPSGANAGALGTTPTPLVKGSYKPTVAALAPTSATLEAGWVSLREPQVAAPAGG